jgi:D-beta-D-heptose 7-phosphate kinase/D-beta-D-heptose 1-phosphate adenosyltransferase
LPRGPQRTGLPEDPGRKVISRTAARALFARLRAEGRRIVFTNGCFDILHAGHAQYLRKAASLGDVLVVGLNSDASIRRLKGEGRPVQQQRDRAYLLASLACVSFVVVFTEDTPAKLIEAVVPHVLVKGADWKGKEIVGGSFVKAHGGTVKTIRFLPGRSTTSIIARAASGNGSKGC